MVLDQLALEHWWVNLFRENGRLSSQRLRSSGRASSDPSLRRFITNETFNLFRRTNEEILNPRRGTRSDNATYLLKLIESMEGIALSHLVISAALNHILSESSRDCTLPAIGSSLVRAVELELKIRFIEKVHPKLAAAHHRARGTFVHRNRALMAVAGRASASGLPNFFADSSVRSRLGLALTEMVLLASGIFEPFLAPYKGSQRIWCIRVRESVVGVFNRTQSLDEFLSYVPPLGLYLEPLPAHRDTEHPFILDRRPMVSYNWLSGAKPHNNPPALIQSCLNRLNRVGYQVNHEMLEWIKRHSTALSGRGILPNLIEPRAGATREMYDAWAAGVGKRRVYHRTFLLAKQLGNTTFYHDWYVDFRGRMYTTSSIFSPQGTPMNKAIICFNETVRVTGEGDEYREFLEYGARMIWGKADISNANLRDIFNRGYITAALNGELGVETLNDPKDYLPFVAWCMEAKKLLDNGWVDTGIMLRRDATASSIQHMSTWAADRNIMRMVNISDVPEHRVSDIYTMLNQSNLERKPLKQFVMTYCYNSTTYGRSEERAIRELGNKYKWRQFVEEDKRTEAALAPLLVNLARVRDSISEMGESCDFQFTTPSGIQWSGMRYKWPTTQVYVRFNSTRIRINLKTPKEDAPPNLTKARSSYVANVIHSLDASQLHRCVSEWPPSVAFIHDCYVALPGQMDTLGRSLRVSFFWMHKQIFSSIKCNEGVAKADELDYDKYIENSRYMFI